MGIDIHCELCGSVVKRHPLEGILISKGTGKTYNDFSDYNNAGETPANYRVVCNNCCEQEKQKSEQEKQKTQNFLITTTSSIDGKIILEYKGIVTAHVFMGVNIFKDIFSGVRDIVGGRSKAMESELNKAKDLLMNEIKEEALRMNANAIIGLKVDFEDIGKTSGNAFMLLGTGTAVVLENKSIAEF